MTGCSAPCSCSKSPKTINFVCPSRQTSTDDMKPSTESIACGQCKTNDFWEDLNSFMELSHKIMSYAKKHMEEEKRKELDNDSELDTESECDCEAPESSSYHTARTEFDVVDCPGSNYDCQADCENFSPVKASTPTTRSNKPSRTNLQCGSKCCTCPNELRSPGYPPRPNYSNRTPFSFRSGFGVSFPPGQTRVPISTAGQGGFGTGSDPRSREGLYGTSFPIEGGSPQRSAAARSRTHDSWGGGGFGSSPFNSGTPQRGVPARIGTPDSWGGGSGGGFGSSPITNASSSPPFPQTANAVICSDPDSFEWLDPAAVMAEDVDPLHVNINFDIEPNPATEPAEWRFYESSFPGVQPPHRPMCTGARDYTHDESCPLQTPSVPRPILRKTDSIPSICRPPLCSLSPRSSPPRTVQSRNSPRFSRPTSPQFPCSFRFSDSNPRHTV